MRSYFRSVHRTLPENNRTPVARVKQAGQWNYARDPVAITLIDPALALMDHSPSRMLRKGSQPSWQLLMSTVSLLGSICVR